MARFQGALVFTWIVFMIAEYLLRGASPDTSSLNVLLQFNVLRMENEFAWFNLPFPIPVGPFELFLALGSLATWGFSFLGGPLWPARLFLLVFSGIMFWDVVTSVGVRLISAMGTLIGAIAQTVRAFLPF